MNWGIIIKMIKPRIKKLKDKIIIVISSLAVVSSFIFVWMLELLFNYNGNDLTNGFMIFDGLKVYHFWMYIMLGSVLLTYIFIINLLEGNK